MASREESIQSVLAARSYTYTFFQSIFGNEPAQEQFAILAGEVSRDTLEFFSVDECPAYAESLSAVKAALDAVSENPEGFLGKLGDEYTQLFIGPHELLAPPWESVYTTKERLLFQESTLEVRNAYRAQGFIPAKYPHVADDHLALELDFMARLAEAACEAYRDGDTAAVRGKLGASGDFIMGHLGIWVPEFAGKIQEASGSFFYPKAARLLEGFLPLDKKVIAEVLSAI